MQKHEGPQRDHKGDARERQRRLTRGLVVVIVILSGAVVAALFNRFR